MSNDRPFDVATMQRAATVNQRCGLFDFVARSPSAAISFLLPPLRCICIASRRPRQAMRLVHSVCKLCRHVNCQRFIVTVSTSTASGAQPSPSVNRRWHQRHRQLLHCHGYINIQTNIYRNIYICVCLRTHLHMYICVCHILVHIICMYIYLRVGWKQGAQVFNYPEMVVDTVSPPHVSPSFV